MQRGVVPGARRPSSSGAGGVWLGAGGHQACSRGQYWGRCNQQLQVCRLGELCWRSLDRNRERKACRKTWRQSSPWHSCNQRDVLRSSSGGIGVVLLKQDHMVCVDVITHSQWILNSGARPARGEPVWVSDVLRRVQT